MVTEDSEDKGLQGDGGTLVKPAELPATDLGPQTHKQTRTRPAGLATLDSKSHQRWDGDGIVHHGPGSLGFCKVSRHQIYQEAGENTACWAASSEFLI